MNRMLKTTALGLLLAAALTLAIPTQAHAQVIIVQSPPVYGPAPIVTTYPAYSAPRYVVPSVAYSAPYTTYSLPITTYSAPRVSYYPAPVAYAAPIATTYSGYAAPVVAYSAPIATPYYSG